MSFTTCYYTPNVLYPPGGRLNRAVNLTSQYLIQAGSRLDLVKMEELSWGGTYRNFTDAQDTIAFPVTAPAVGLKQVGRAAFCKAGPTTT